MGTAAVAAAELAGATAATVAQAARDVDSGMRVTQVGSGAAEAIGAAVMDESVANIEAAASGTTPAASATAAKAASIAARTVLDMTMGPDDAAYAVAAALGAVRGGATVAQAAAIAAAIVATVAVATARITATVTTAAGMHTNLGADQMERGTAALAGAVAAAAYWLGRPAKVHKATSTALTKAGFAPNAATHATDAQNAATINAGDNTLFRVLFTTSVGDEIKSHSE